MSESRVVIRSSRESRPPGGLLLPRSYAYASSADRHLSLAYARPYSSFLPNVKAHLCGMEARIQRGGLSPLDCAACSEICLKAKRSVKSSPVGLRLLDGGGSRIWIKCYYLQMLAVAHTIRVTRKLPSTASIPTAHLDSRACDFFDVDSTLAVFQVDLVAHSHIMNPWIIRCKLG